MKQLDTDTVLKIIEMIDYRLTASIKAHHIDKEYFSGKIDAYDELAHHLQDYIEGLVSQAENNLNAGE